MREKILVEISGRLIHLSQYFFFFLFGKNYKLKKLRQLTEVKEFATRETLTLRIGPREIPKVRIVGPTREQTQVEISLTDAIFLRIKAPVRISGNLEGTPGAILIGPQGKVELKKGVIIPWRHIHCSPRESKTLGFKNGDLVSVEVRGKRALVFHNVKVRVDKNYRLCLHLDTDEGNACGITKKGEGIILKT
jgi:propanediol utilization protein